MKNKIKFKSLKKTFQRDIKGNKKRERLYKIGRAKLKESEKAIMKIKRFHDPDMPVGKLTKVKDFLPPPNKLIFPKIKRTRLKDVITRRPTHPGEILLEEFLRPKKMTRQKLAKKTGVPVQKINSLINGKRRMTCETAILLSEVFGTTAEFWMTLQINYDLFTVRSKDALK